jgi:DNA recombination protein RmuC
MEWLFLLAGLIAGGIVSFVIARLSGRSKTLELEKELESRNAFSVQEKAELDKRIGVLDNQLLMAREENEKISDRLEREAIQRERAEKEVAIRNEAYANLEEKLREEKKNLEELEKRFKAEFENLATRILKSNTEEFEKSSNKKLSDVLTPLKEKIEKFEAKVQETYDKGKEDHLNLKNELKNLQELSLRLDEDARNLTKALKADTKKQGNWGEVILERVLERSGLNKGEEYYLQFSSTAEDGSRLRPDVVIRLPEEKHLVIDSKVSLTAYTEYVSAEDEEQRERALKRHLDSIKKHIKQLSEKNYSDLLGINSPDFVLMFLPVEPAFGLAVQQDQELFNFAWQKRIVIVSPTTLLATLRTVASIWKYEKQSQNALEIARRGGLLYDKFESFVKDLERVGSSIENAEKAYLAAHSKLSSGRGNLLNQVEQLKKMGVTTKKSLPSEYLDNE